jgi:glycosyltransferase involved in cell wall biosynthesis
MAVYNAGHYLDAAVESVLEQTCGDFELVAVNDGSTDGSGEALRRWAGRDARIRVLSQQNLGVPAAVNHGLRYCRGEYIARMDADDICAPERFALQTAFLDARPDVVAVGSAMQQIDATGRTIGRPVPYPAESSDIEAALLAGRNCFAQPTVMLRRSGLEAVNGYRWAFRPAEDYDLWLRLSERYPLANLADVLLQYRVHSGSITTRQPHVLELAHRAALATATLRRAGRDDPIGDAMELTPDLLEKLGISRTEAEWVCVQAFRTRASNLLLVGDVDAAEGVLGALGRHGFSPEALRRIEPEVRFVRARIDAARGRWLRATLHAVLTLARYPSFVAALLRKVGRQLLWRLGRRPAA